jgi:hypothetical protein
MLLPVSRGRAEPLSPAEVSAMSANLRGMVVQFLPDPLYHNEKHWGGQKQIANGITWRGKGLDVHPEVQHKSVNHGTWWRVRVTTPNRGESLALELRDWQAPEPGRITFTAAIALDTEFDYERQVWEEGIRLWSGSVRGRTRALLTLYCEATTRTEPLPKGLPDVVFRLRVVKSECGYNSLRIDHINGVGGEVAKLYGEAAKGAVQVWHPALERKLLEKANAAIIKAGDTKEVRISLGKILGK